MSSLKEIFEEEAKLIDPAWQALVAGGYQQEPARQWDTLAKNWLARAHSGLQRGMSIDPYYSAVGQRFNVVAKHSIDLSKRGLIDPTATETFFNTLPGEIQRSGEGFLETLKKYAKWIVIGLAAWLAYDVWRNRK